MTEKRLRPDQILRGAGDYVEAAPLNQPSGPQSQPGLHHWIWGQMTVLADAVIAGTEPSNRA